MSERKREGSDDAEENLPFVLSVGLPPRKRTPPQITETRRKTPPMPWGAVAADAGKTPAPKAPEVPRIQIAPASPQRSVTVDATPAARAARAQKLAESAPTPAPPRTSSDVKRRHEGPGERYAELDHRVDVVGNVGPISRPVGPVSKPREAPLGASGGGALPGARAAVGPNEPFDLEAALAPHLGWLDEEGKFELLAHLAKGDHARAIAMMTDAHQRFPRIVSITKAQQIIERAAISRLLKRIGQHDAMPSIRGRPAVTRDAGKVLELVDGRSTFDEILQRSTLTRLRTLEVLDDLVRRGALDVPDVRPAQRVAVEAKSPPAPSVSQKPVAAPASAPPPPVSTARPPRAEQARAARVDSPLPPASSERASARPAPGIRVPNTLGATAAKVYARQATVPFERKPRNITLPFGEDADGRVTLNDPIEVAAHVSLLREPATPPPTPIASKALSSVPPRAAPKSQPPPVPDLLGAGPLGSLDDDAIPGLVPLDAKAPSEKPKPAAELAARALQDILPVTPSDEGGESDEEPREPLPRLFMPLRTKPESDASSDDTSPARAAAENVEKEAAPPSFDLDHGPSSAPARRPSLAGASSSQRVITSTRGLALEAAAPGRPKWVMPLALLVGAALLTSVVAVFLMLKKRDAADQQASAAPTASAAAPAPTAATAAPTASAAVATKDATLQLTIDVTPRQAQVFLDQVLLTEHPIKRTIPRDGDLHQIRIESYGYKTLRTTFNATGDTNLILSLELLPNRPAPPPTATPAAPTGAAPGPGPAPTHAPGGDDPYGGGL